VNATANATKSLSQQANPVPINATKSVNASANATLAKPIQKASASNQTVAVQANATKSQNLSQKKQVELTEKEKKFQEMKHNEAEVEQLANAADKQRAPKPTQQSLKIYLRKSRLN